jgi:hypothetical protein
VGFILLVAVVCFFIVVLTVLENRGRHDRRAHRRALQDLAAATETIRRIDKEIRDQNQSGQAPELWPISTLIDDYHTQQAARANKEIA